MNNDRELLEQAAKAAGIKWTKWCDINNGSLQVPKDPVPESANPFHYWNPLTDDGDALRLAVKLGLLFKYMIDRYELFMRFYCEELDNDLKPSEATRRAIVRAAAEIGKEQK